MRRAAITAISVAGLLLTTGAPAFGDAHQKPLYLIECDGLSVTVTSPDHAAAGQDLDSTHVLVAPFGRVPEAQIMTCTATELAPGGQVFEAPFLIRPATH
jgi:hypothetical protein